MRKNFMSRLIAVFALVLFIGISPLQLVSANTSTNEGATDNQISAELSWTVQANYLALGDSLAAGIDYEGKTGNGYADYLKDALSNDGLLLSYSKAFAANGYTTVDVLSDLKENATREVDGETVSLRDAIENANLITISAGANDVLKHINAKTLTFDEQLIAEEVKKVGANLAQIVTAIHTINPDAQIYLMGYYNPFPYLPEEIQPSLAKLLAGLNQAIGSVAQMPNVEWVETADTIAENFESHLPNPQNIHLSPEGYQSVAKLFLEKVQSEYPWIPKDALTTDMAADSVTLQWKTASPADQIAGYNIYSGDEKIGSVDGDVYSFTVEALEEGQAYNFSIVAVDKDGNESAEHLSTTVTLEADAPLFSDTDGHWAEEAIGQAALLGIFNGYDDGTFRPDNTLTRAQAAAVFLRTLNLPTVEDAIVFDDIDDYAGATQSNIRSVFVHGLAKGQNEQFVPTEELTRVELALMAKRVLDKALGDEIAASDSFPQATDMDDFGNEAVEAISVLSGLGVIALEEDGGFNPTAPATRAFAASLLTKLVSLADQ